MKLITGGTGFLGRHLLESLNGPCIFTGRNDAIGRDIEISTGHRFYRIDHARDDLKVLPRVSQVVHAAALSAPFGSSLEFYESNVVATRRLLDYAISAGAERFVYISTPSLYFDFQHHRNIPEEYLARNRVNMYAETKYQAELEVLQASKEIEVVILRPRGIFGKYDTAIFPRLLRLSQSGGIPLTNDGDALIDITHVSNVVQAIDKALSSPIGIEKVFNITNGEPMQVKALLAMLSDATGTAIKTRNVKPWLLGSVAATLDILGHLTGIEPPVTRYTASLLQYDQTLDISRAKRCLGYAPTVTIQQGLADYASNAAS